ncbi:MAG: hypothetical protein JWN48_5138 [Myxococcaceae bacterium]|nr:hypothetical protein [Myxococcaceae bacterium]
MLETAFDSIPIDSDAVSEVLVRHHGGRWDWGGPVRERILAHPKVRLLEFPDKVDWGDSFNRTLDAIESPWGIVLPDDDFLIRPVAKAAFEAALVHAGDVGYIAFDWYYLKRGRYVASPSYVSRAFKPGLRATVKFTPKLVTTMLNLRHVRALGGFQNMGGFTDTVLFGRLSYEFDALLVGMRAGVYRLHGGQESARLDEVYGRHLENVHKTLYRYARSDREREEFDRTLREWVWPEAESRLHGARARLQDVSYELRSRGAPSLTPGTLKLRKWSSV